MEGVSDRLGSDIIVLDMRDVSLLADYFVLCSAASPPQFQAIVDEVEKRAKAAGNRHRHAEGDPESGWVLLDYGSVVVHIFEPEVRVYYDLEGLWKQAPTVVRVQ